MIPKDQLASEWKTLLGQFQKIREDAPESLLATHPRVFDKLTEILCGKTTVEKVDNPMVWGLCWSTQWEKSKLVATQLAAQAKAMVDFVGTFNHNHHAIEIIGESFPGKHGWKNLKPTAPYKLPGSVKEKPAAAKSSDKKLFVIIHSRTENIGPDMFRRRDQSYLKVGDHAPTPQEAIDEFNIPYGRHGGDQILITAFQMTDLQRVGLGPIDNPSQTRENNPS